MDTAQDIVNKTKYEYLKEGVLHVLKDLQSRQQYHENKGHRTQAKNAEDSIQKIANYIGLVEELLEEKERPIIEVITEERRPIIPIPDIPKLEQLKGNIKQKYAQLMAALTMKLTVTNQEQTKVMSNYTYELREQRRATSIQQVKQSLPQLFRPYQKAI